MLIIVYKIDEKKFFLLMLNDNMSSQYKLLVENRDYSNWILYDALSLNEIEKIDIKPADLKLFSHDIFEFQDNQCNILHSSIRCSPSIPGVLILKENKTYGKYKDKYLYKCVPDDKRLPIFLIPYQLKLAFSKNIDNKYIVFKYNHWNSKHPQGTVVSVLGDVDVLSSFYEYQLYCKSLYASIQTFNKATSDVLKQKTEKEFISSIIEKYKLIDRTHEQVFSIDSSNTTDFDDAFSIEETGKNSFKLSIYIANVPLWMEELNLWNSFSERISTIYLPDRKRPMLPLSLSNCLCSLCENVVRLAFAIDITIVDNEIVGYKIENTFIKVYKNHVYDSKELLQDSNYKKMFSLTDELCKVYKYTTKLKGSYDMVSYLMILMNYYCATSLINFNTGIYRSVQFKKIYEKDSTLPEDVNNFLKIWNSSFGQYDLFDNKTCHQMLQLDSYIHCTSPIRRLVDLLNMALLQINLNLNNFGPEFYKFYEYWIGRIDYINTTMRAIRKIQNDCSLLEMCVNNPKICEKIYDGYVFDKIERNDGLFQYVVYLVELKTVSRITVRQNINDNAKYNFKLYIFEDEDTLKKKVRLHLII